MSNGDRLTIADLPRVFFRAEARTVDAATATDAEFDSWVRSRVILIGGRDDTWTPQQRAEFCDRLYRLGALVLAPQDTTDGREAGRDKEDGDEAALLGTAGRKKNAPKPARKHANRDEKREKREKGEADHVDK